MATGMDLPDHVRRMKFSSVAGSRNGHGFCYSRHPAAAEDTALKVRNRDQMVCFHRLGDPQGAGHGARKPTSQGIDAAVKRCAFVVRNLQLRRPPDFGK